jgi:hypothetical protein
LVFHLKARTLTEGSEGTLGTDRRLVWLRTGSAADTVSGGGFTVMEKMWIGSTHRVGEKHVGRGERALQHNFRDHALDTTVSNFRDWFR